MGPLPPLAPAVAADEETSSSQVAPAAVPEPPHGTGDDLIDDRPAPGLRPSRHGGGRAWRRGQAAAVLAAIVLFAGAGGLALLLHGAPSPRSSGSHAGTSRELAAEAAARKQAITWIVRQVNRAEVVSCDSQMCADLASKGFPTGSLLMLGSGSADPVASNLVVATAVVRAQYGRRLASVYAPAVIASFGSGNARIDIRWVFPGGAARYRAVQQPTLRARKATDARLLANSQVTFSTLARAQLRRGDIDPRLPLLISLMAANGHPVHIVDFFDQSPGGGPASLLRSVDLATADRAAHLTAAAYLGWMRAFINVQRAPYRPTWSQPVTLRPGQAVLRIGYGAPSPLSPPPSGGSPAGRQPAQGQGHG